MAKRKKRVTRNEKQETFGRATTYLRIQKEADRKRKARGLNQEFLAVTI